MTTNAVDSAPLHTAVIASPLGPLTLVATDQALVEVAFGRRSGRARHRRPPPVLAAAVAQLRDWLAGEREDFDLPLAPSGTPFQRKVWAALRRIPRGETRSYADIARQVGRPAAVRAVGAANGRNPLAIVIPCHRVVGSDGSLTGYGGGLRRKRWLLRHEGAPPRGGDA